MTFLKEREYSLPVRIGTRANGTASGGSSFTPESVVGVRVHVTIRVECGHYDELVVGHVLGQRRVGQQGVHSPQAEGCRDPFASMDAAFKENGWLACVTNYDARDFTLLECCSNSQVLGFG